MNRSNGARAERHPPTEAERRELLAWAASEDLDALHRRANDFDHNRESLWADFERLRREHPNRWVAYAHGELKAVADSVEDLLQRAEELELDRGTLYAEFIHDPEPVWML
jgi:hypothetical protein